MSSKDDLVVSARVIIPAKDLSYSAVRSSGPGGQNVNKLATKVELRFDLESCTALDDTTKTRLRTLAGSRLTQDGQLVLVAQETRSQSQNLELAREKLVELVKAALHRPKKRRPTKPTKGSKERRLKAKRAAGDKKRGRGRITDD
jgi:ribosome-associated protein